MQYFVVLRTNNKKAHEKKICLQMPEAIVAIRDYFPAAWIIEHREDKLFLLKQNDCG